VTRLIPVFDCFLKNIYWNNEKWGKKVAVTPFLRYIEEYL